MTDLDVISAFADFLHGHGVEPPRHIIADGALHRCNTVNRNGKNDASYVLHVDGEVPAGWCRNWRTGSDGNWHAQMERGPLTDSERAPYQRRVDEVKKQQDADRRQRFAETAERAERLLQDTRPGDDDHAYLRLKTVGAHGLRIDHRGLLIVLVRDLDGRLQTLQYIDDDGGKKNLTGSQAEGGCHIIGGPLDGQKIIAIATGYATGATIHEVVGYPCVCALGDDNLIIIAQALRERYPQAQLIVCADDDHSKRNPQGERYNSGLTKGREAAALAKAHLAVPHFAGPGRGDRDTDFNDLLRFTDTAYTVRDQIAAALKSPDLYQGRTQWCRIAAMDR